MNERAPDPGPRQGEQPEDPALTRRPTKSRKGLIIGLATGGAAVAAVGVFMLSNDDGTRPYTLAAPATAAGFPIDPAATKSIATTDAFNADFKQRVTAALGGKANGDMFAVYTDTADGLKISLEGMTGTGFAPHRLKSGVDRLLREANNPPFHLQSVDAGSNGGAAVCSPYTAGIGCSWLTSTTFVTIDFSAADGTNKLQLNKAVELLHTIRPAVEKPA
jgi:hypothetical protein